MFLEGSTAMGIRQSDPADGDRATAHEDELARLFAAARPGADALDVDQLLAGAVLRRLRRGRAGWLLASAASLLCALGGVVGGWQAGRQSAAAESKLLAESLSKHRQQVSLSSVRLVAASHRALQEDQQQWAKQVAVMVRRDYLPRIAALENELVYLNQSLADVKTALDVSTAIAARVPYLPAGAALQQP